MVKGNANFDPSQFRGVSEVSGGVFGMAKREVTEFDLKLVYKHQQAQQLLKNSQIPNIGAAAAKSTSEQKGAGAAVRLVHSNNNEAASGHGQTTM